MMSRLLILAWMPNDVARLSIGFVVSKRISKRAVERNYIKRLLSEAIRAALPRLGVGLDIVVSARQQAGTGDLHTLEQGMLALLERAQLLKDRPEAKTKEGHRQGNIWHLFFSGVIKKPRRYDLLYLVGS